jgi:predicted HNH restriction endonuclease
MPTPVSEEQKESASERKRRLGKEASARFRKLNPDKVKESRLKAESTARNKELRRLRQRRHHIQIRLKAIAELGGKCVHCQQVFHPAAMDFHHLDPSTKEVKGRGIPAGNSWEKVQKELAKTILLCANCHRIHHYKERNLDEELL